MLAAVIPAKGIGDALLMMITSHQLLEQGWEVTCYHPALNELKDWFDPRFRFESLPLDLEEFSKFSLIVVENDNSEKVKALKKLPKTAQKTAIFYPTYQRQKHGPLSAKDQVFDANRPMAENIAEATRRLLGLPKQISAHSHNGMQPLPGLVHRRYPKRVVIHPTSSQIQKNWEATSYLTLATLLKEQGFEPIFAITEQERPLFPEGQAFSHLSDLATFVYESGAMIGNDSLVGHLASSLQIPTLIVADNAERMRLWRPGWLLGDIVTPSFLIPNFKGLRLRHRHWKRWISPRKVLNAFNTFYTHCNK